MFFMQCLVAFFFLSKIGLFVKACDENCVDGCDNLTGLCIFCRKGYYGIDCLKICSRNCKNGCDRFTGNCVKGCKSRFYAAWCMERCDPGCLGACDQTTGKCYSCKNGRHGDWCNNPCPKNCQGGCNRDNGNCYRCKDGWYGASCSSKCRGNCHGGCDQVSGSCSACRQGFYGSKCEQNCPNKCKNAYCRSDSYGSCVDCEDGYYGSNCSRTCSSKCNSGCHFTSGNCYACEGFYSTDCSKCPDNCEGNCDTNGLCYTCLQGYYGRECSSSCPANCIGPCQKADGMCLVCEGGYHGDFCNLACPSSCLLKCNKVTGNCTKSSGRLETPGGIPIAAIVVPVTVVVVLALIISAVIIIWRKRRQRFKERNDRPSLRFSGLPVSSRSRLQADVPVDNAVQEQPHRSRSLEPNTGTQNLEQRAPGHNYQIQRASTNTASSRRSSYLYRMPPLPQINWEAVQISADPESETQLKVPFDEASICITSDEYVEHEMQTLKP